jgi:serine/threonine protein kinase
MSEQLPGPLEQLGAVVEEFLARYRRGDNPDVEQYARSFPHLADDLRELLPVLPEMEQARPEDTGTTVTGAKDPYPRIDNYRILREVGRGGMGVVYEAEDLRLERRVALKVLPPGCGKDAGARDRFANEMRMGAQMHHTHIVPVYEVGQAGEQLYYTMPLIDGASLDRVIADLRHLRAPSTPRSSPSDLIAPDSGPGPRSRPTFFDQVARIAKQAALALQHAHEHKIHHRDIKPHNLIMDRQGDIWLTDFGLALAVDRDPANQGGGGTPVYAAPEVFDGHADGRSDIYSLGLTLYELMSQEPAFAGNRLTDLPRLKSRGQLAPLRRVCPGVPADLQAVVHKAIAPSPGDRYQTAQEMADDLDAYLKRQTLPRDRYNLPKRLIRWGQREPALVGVLLLLACTAVLLVSVWVGKRVNEARFVETSARRQLISAADTLYEQGNLAAAERKYTEALATETGERVRLEVRRLRCRFALGEHLALGEELEEFARREDLGEWLPTLRLLHGDYLLCYQDHQGRGRRLVEDALAERQHLSGADAAYAEGLLAVTGKQAISRYQRAIRLEPHHHRAHSALTAEFLCQGRLAEARASARFMQLVFSTDPLPKFVEAMTDLLEGQPDRAIERLRGLEASLGRQRMMDLTTFARDLGAMLRLLEQWGEGREGIGLEVPGLLARGLSISARALRAIGPLGIGVPAVQRLFQRWERLRPVLVGLMLAPLVPLRPAQLDAAVAQLSLALEEGPEGTLFYLRAAHRLHLAAHCYRKGDRQKLRTTLVALGEDAQQTLSAPTLVPSPALRYQARFMAFMADAALYADFNDRDPKRIRRLVDNLAFLVSEGQEFPQSRNNILTKTASGLPSNFARLLLGFWQQNEPDNPTIDRLLAHINLQAKNYTEALYAARRVLARQPRDKEMLQVVEQALQGMAKLTAAKK